MFNERDNVIVRFHSDKDNSFMGVVESFAQEQAWLNTTTEGCDSNLNSRVERSKERLVAGPRANLLGATGGRLYYEALWNVGMTHMADMVSHLPEVGCHTPATRAGGEELVVDDIMEVFGAQVHYNRVGYFTTGGVLRLCYFFTTSWRNGKFRGPCGSPCKGNRAPGEGDTAV